MKVKAMYVLSFVIYVVFVLALIAVYMGCKDDEDTMLMGMYALSSALMLVTIVLAVLFYRKTTSEQYRELYMNEEKEKEEWEKK